MKKYIFPTSIYWCNISEVVRIPRIKDLPEHKIAKCKALEAMRQKKCLKKSNFNLLLLCQNGWRSETLAHRLKIACNGSIQLPPIKESIPTLSTTPSCFLFFFADSGGTCPTMHWENAPYPCSTNPTYPIRGAGKRWASPLKGHIRAKIHSQEHRMKKKTSLNCTCHFFSSRNSMDHYT